MLTMDYKESGSNPGSGRQIKFTAMHTLCSFINMLSRSYQH